jgi:hypothetical protein
MVAPRVPISDLPEQVTPEPTNLLIVQDDAVTKKITVQHLMTDTINAAVNTHIIDPIDSHDASAISVVPTGGIASNNVQSALTEILSRNISTVAPLTGGGNLQTDRTLAVDQFTGTVPGTVPASPGGTTNFLRADGNWAAPAGGSSGGGGTGALFTSTTQGEVPASGGSPTDYLAANGVWSTPATSGGGGGITADDAVDAVAAQLVVSNGITKVYNDSANQLALGLNGVPTSVVTGLDSALAAKANAATTLTTTTPITGGGTLAALAPIGISNFTPSNPGAVPAPGGTSSGRYLRDDGSWSLTSEGTSAVGTIFPYLYSSSTVETGMAAPQLRGNNATVGASTRLWMAEVTQDAVDVTLGLGRIKAGFQVYLQDYTTPSRYALFTVTADSVDKGAYWELSVVPVLSSGTITTTTRVILQYFSAAQANSLFSTTTTARGLAPGSNGAATTNFLRADGTWAVPAGGTGGSAIVQQPNPPTDTTVLWADTDEVSLEENVRYLSTNAGTSYTLVAGDRGKLILCSNASPQTVTVPPNASVAYSIGTQIDLVQTGAGVLTVAQGGGVTVNATPSRAFRAQYSGASLVKTATDTWLLMGDLA